MANSKKLTPLTVGITVLTIIATVLFTFWLTLTVIGKHKVTQALDERRSLGMACSVDDLPLNIGPETANAIYREIFSAYSNYGTTDLAPEYHHDINQWIERQDETINQAIANEFIAWWDSRAQELLPLLERASSTVVSGHHPADLNLGISRNLPEVNLEQQLSKLLEFASACFFYVGKQREALDLAKHNYHLARHRYTSATSLIEFLVGLSIHASAQRPIINHISQVDQFDHPTLLFLYDFTQQNKLDEPYRRSRDFEFIGINQSMDDMSEDFGLMSFHGHSADYLSIYGKTPLLYFDQAELIRSFTHSTNPDPDRYPIAALIFSGYDATERSIQQSYDQSIALHFSLQLLGAPVPAVTLPKSYTHIDFRDGFLLKHHEKPEISIAVGPSAEQELAENPWP